MAKKELKASNEFSDRERETEREREADRERETERDRQRERQRQRETKRDREIERQTDRDRENQWHFSRPLLMLTARPLSWVEAQMHCTSLGGYLASLNTPQERDDVMNLLSMRRTPTATFLGLKYPDSSLPYL